MFVRDAWKDTDCLLLQDIGSASEGQGDVVQKYPRQAEYTSIRRYSATTCEGIIYAAEIHDARYIALRI